MSSLKNNKKKLENSETDVVIFDQMNNNCKCITIQKYLFINYENIFRKNAVSTKIVKQCPKFVFNIQREELCMLTI